MKSGTQFALQVTDCLQSGRHPDAVSIYMNKKKQGLTGPALHSMRGAIDRLQIDLPAQRANADKA